MTKSKNWIEQTADNVEEFVRQKTGSKIICASGISPSGPIHLGNLRELMTVHLITEELLSRGRNAEHIHSWDDFDRLRKVPANVPESFQQFIGRPICDIPDPFGEYVSYAERYIVEFERSVRRLGVRPRYIRQSTAYRRGDYNEQIKIAMDRRFEIFDILSQFQTLERHEKSANERRLEYYPFKVYCEFCQTDATVIISYEPDTEAIVYVCQNCGHKGSFRINEKVSGKLVWKVDWPMRWSFEGVDFEPGGEDHSSPGSSYTVGKEIVSKIYGGVAPYFVGYAFVGLAGRSKISSSVGTSATPQIALEILEPAILRWLYIRRHVGQKFDVDFGREILRLYDEWDALVTRVTNGKGTETDQATYGRCIQTSQGKVKRSELLVSFRILSSAADITQGNVEQILRIVSDHLDNPPDMSTLKELLEPRLTCAINWATNYLPEDERTHVNARHDQLTYAALSKAHQCGISILLERLDENWSLKGLTSLIYGIPKLIIGLPIDAPPSEEIKIVQRGFFTSIYRMLCGRDTGPRLPTLFLSLGQERLRTLLSSESRPIAQSAQLPGE